MVNDTLIESLDRTKYPSTKDAHGFTYSKAVDYNAGVDRCMELVRQHEDKQYKALEQNLESMKHTNAALIKRLQQQEDQRGEISVVDAHSSDPWNPPTLETLQRWRKHKVITYRDWTGVLDMVESHLRIPKRESVALSDEDKKEIVSLMVGRAQAMGEISLQRNAPGFIRALLRLWFNNGEDNVWVKKKD